MLKLQELNQTRVARLGVFNPFETCYLVVKTKCKYTNSCQCNYIKNILFKQIFELLQFIGQHMKEYWRAVNPGRFVEGVAAYFESLQRAAEKVGDGFFLEFFFARLIF